MLGELSLGINNKPINEAMAIIYSECQKEKFSGISYSFGAGMVNCVMAWRGVEACKFSTARSGDFIDNSVADSLDIVSNRVTSIKEKYLDLSCDQTNYENKKIARILEALHFYYESIRRISITRSYQFII